LVTFWVATLDPFITVLLKVNPLNCRRSRAFFSIIVFLFLVVTHSVGQSSYYLSSIGNDANDGRSTQSPWKSIPKLNSTKLNPGDAVFFRRGDEFFGQIDVNQSGSQSLPIAFGAYGSTGHKPVISGAVHLSGWVAYKGSIYSTTAPYPVKNLFVDGVQMTLARYPNSGFLNVGMTNGSTTFSATGSFLPAGYWNGANVRIRTTTFSFETRRVGSYDGNTITLESPTTYPIVQGSGFYFDNVFGELTFPGEWYCEEGTNTIYFYPPGGVDPNQLDINASVLDFGINGTASISNLSVNDLVFQYQIQAGVAFGGATTSNRVLSNEILNQLADGVRIDGVSANVIVDGNIIQQINGRGIFFENSRQSTIMNNTVKNVGLVQGYGSSASNGMCGIIVAGGFNNKIQDNRIDSIGYIGIRPDGANNLVENNVLSNVMLKLADGGGIYCYGDNSGLTFGTTIRNNIIEKVIGDVVGVSYTTSKSAAGIYLDYGAKAMLIEGNTIVDAASQGIMVNYNSYQHTFRNNVLYGCGSQGGVSLRIVQDTTKNFGQNVVKKNIFYPLDSTQMLVDVQGEQFHPIGILDSNYYCNPDNDRLLQITTLSNGWTPSKFSLEQWKAFTGQDQNSKGLFAKTVQFVVTDTSAPNLVSNGSFDANVSGWVDWYTNARLHYTTDGGLDGGCLQFVLTNAQIADGASASPTIALTRGEWYQLRFSVRAPHHGFLTVAVRQNHAPHNALTAPMEFTLSSNRRDYTCLLSADTSDTDVRVEFRVAYPDSAFFLDNVSIRHVKGTYVPPQYRAPIFINRTDQIQTVNLSGERYHDLDGNPLTGSIVLGPFSSQVLIRDAVFTGIANGGVTESHEKPDHIILFQNYPNPFNPTTVVRYGLPTLARVSLTIYDSIGRLIAVLVDQTMDAGYHEVTFTKSNLSTGVYFCRLNVGSASVTRKLLVIK
jgi:parallel beta-helix repeat protein